jgi:NAD(P)H-hydrate epimerase
LGQVLEQIASHPGPVLAVDLPSGLSGDTGRSLGTVKRAHLTVTVGTYKRGLFLNQGPDLAGTVKLADLGLTPQMFEKVSPQGLYLDSVLAKTFLPLRPANGHKGTFGHAVVVGGSVGKTGALALASLGALRSGCGLVTAGHPLSLAQTFAQKLTSAMTLGLPDDPAGQFSSLAADPLIKFIDQKKTLGLGPGLGLGDGAQALVRQVCLNLKRPMVLDADALTLLKDKLEIVAKSPAARILTPHPGEAGVLLGITSQQVQADRFKALETIASVSQAVVVLKGQYTLIKDPLSGRYLVNQSGNSALAVGGAGDILTGLITGLLAQGLEPFAAAGLGVFIHGQAGDLGAQHFGSRGLMPEEMAGFLPRILTELAV